MLRERESKAVEVEETFEFDRLLAKPKASRSHLVDVVTAPEPEPEVKPCAWCGRVHA